MIFEVALLSQLEKGAKDVLSEQLLVVELSAVLDLLKFYLFLQPRLLFKPQLLQFGLPLLLLFLCDLLLSFELFLPPQFLLLLFLDSLLLFVELLELLPLFGSELRTFFHFCDLFGSTLGY